MLVASLCVYVTRGDKSINSKFKVIFVHKPWYYLARVIVNTINIIHSVIMCLYTCNPSCATEAHKKNTNWHANFATTGLTVLLRLCTHSHYEQLCRAVTATDSTLVPAVSCSHVLIMSLMLSRSDYDNATLYCLPDYYALLFLTFLYISIINYQLMAPCCPTIIYVPAHRLRSQ